MPARGRPGGGKWRFLCSFCGKLTPKKKKRVQRVQTEHAGNVCVATTEKAGRAPGAGF